MLALLYTLYDLPFKLDLPATLYTLRSTLYTVYSVDLRSTLYDLFDQIYRSLIFPYTLYGTCIPAWGQASQCDLKEILTLQKRILRLIFFASKRSHAIPLFVASNFLPVNMLYFETVSTIMHDVTTHSTPKNSP